MPQHLDQIAPVKPTRWQLFYNFAWVGLLGFGGVLPWARQMMVDRRGWVNEQTFNELLAIGQFFPGPNVCNVAIIYARKQHGLQGACLAVVGLYCFPSLITVSAGLAYASWWQHQTVQHVFSAISPIATGLMLGTALRLLKAMPPTTANYTVFVLTFILMGVLVVPLWTVLLISMTVSMVWRLIDRNA
ncbi:chromate transporter [Pseudomonas lundensis]|uniref:chromate transporter n=1 Tax=Pseudomonas lundensis TaxID=86185 RepID=UPI0035263468